jgi:transcriptional regulator with GAF, ATPase, and Fis domain
MFEQIIGNRAALESVLEQVGQLAPTDSAVFLDRETCTRKNLLLTGAIAETIERFEMADQSTLFLDDVNAEGSAGN